jgi:hypothetical protein
MLLWLELTLLAQRGVLHPTRRGHLLHRRPFQLLQRGMQPIPRLYY